MSKKNTHLVITRFNENLDWTNQLLPKIDTRYIYNRGKNDIVFDDEKTIMYNEDNVGRESLTIFKHIYDHYHKLPDVLVFFQGQLNDRPDHPTLPLETYFECNINEIIGSLRVKDQSKNWFGNGENKYRITVSQWCNKLGIDDKHGIYIRCNNFAIGKDVIRRFPKSYYKNILENGFFYSQNPFSAYFVELSNINILIGSKSFKFLLTDNYYTTNEKDLQCIKGIHI